MVNEKLAEELAKGAAPFDWGARPYNYYRGVLCESVVLWLADQWEFRRLLK